MNYLNSLNFSSRKVNNLQQFLKYFDALLLNKVDNVENIKVIIQYFSAEEIYLENNESKKLCSNFEDFYNNINKIVGNLPKINNFDFHRFLSIFLLDEFLKINISDFRETILNKIIEKNDLIKNSSQIIKIIIENAGIDSEPDFFFENLNCIKEEESTSFLKLNDTKNAFLEEIIMNIFERKIMKYFELIPDLDEKKLKEYYITYHKQNKNGKYKTGIIFDKSLDIFKETINILNSISESNINNNIKNLNLLKLYSITYVKIYLYYLINFKINDDRGEMDISEIINYINYLSNKNFSKVIKIYILKLIFNFKNCNFEEFKRFSFDKNGIDFYNELARDKNYKDTILIYFFLPSEPSEYDKYNKIFNIYLKDINFNNYHKGFENLLNQNELDLFLIFVLNKIISNLPLLNNESLNTYKNFSKFVNALFKNNKELKFNNLSKILFLFFDFDTYMNKLKPKIIKDNEKIDIQIFEALLYGFRFCVNSLYYEKDEMLENNKKFFTSILSSGCQNIIEKSLIPGIDHKKDLHLITLEHIQNHFKIKFSVLVTGAMFVVVDFIILLILVDFLLPVEVYFVLNAIKNVAGVQK